MKRATTRAVRSLVARVSLPCEPRESVGATRRPRRPIVAATVASSSGVASTLPWPIAVEPTARSSPISSAAGIVERAAPSGPGSWLKPNSSAASTSRFAPSSAPIGANTELQESAKDCAQRPAAGLAVGVLELDALERGLRLHRELLRRLDDLGLERAGERDDLEGRSGRLGSGERDAGEPEHLAAGGPQHGDPAEAARERLDRGALDVGVDRGAHVRAGARVGAGDHPRAGAQDAAGAARQALVELALEPVEPDRRALGHAAAGELRLALRRRRADAPGDLGRERPEVREPVRALRQRRAVAGEDRAARGQRRLALQALAGAQPGEHELRAPVDARAVLLLDHRQPHAPRQPPEDLGLHPNRQLVGLVVGLAGRVGTHLGERDRLSGLTVGAHEALEAGAAARAIGEQRVHRRVVPALPGGRPLARDRGLRRLVAQADEGADAEGGQRDDRERREARLARALAGRRPVAGGARALGRRTGGAGHHASMPEQSASHASQANEPAERAAPVASLA